MFLLTAMTEDRTYVPSDLLSYFINKFVLFCDITAILPFLSLWNFDPDLNIFPTQIQYILGFFGLWGKREEGETV